MEGLRCPSCRSVDPGKSAPLDISCSTSIFNCAARPLAPYCPEKSSSCRPTIRTVARPAPMPVNPFRNGIQEARKLELQNRNLKKRLGRRHIYSWARDPPGSPAVLAGQVPCATYGACATGSFCPCVSAPIPARMP
jgi:hypothetical protein